MIISVIAGMALALVVIFFVWLWKEGHDPILAIAGWAVAAVVLFFALCSVGIDLQNLRQDYVDLKISLQSLQQNWRNTPDLGISIFYWMLEKNGDLGDGESLVDIRVYPLEFHPQYFIIDVEYKKDGVAYVKKMHVTVNDPRQPGNEMIAWTKVLFVEKKGN